ncbi:hypothetical protein AAG570_010747 [Ranatra chinensis]|uniref:RNA-directed DNA polymerase n=1 Tax=Ranatra chinensis TaxID=642074 RepID=A0ABD0YNF5_9HEMI
MGQTEQDAFNWCKEALATVPILQFPNFDKRFTLTTDASQVALGAVLSQGTGTDERPVAFASKKLTPTETRYSTIERELLGIVWAVKNFRPYLLGKRFLIKTDHKPLVWVHKLEETSARVSRWKETLAAYDFEVIHTKGSENVVADCLSRQVNAIENVDEEYAQRFLRDWLADEQDNETIGTDRQEMREWTETEAIINNKVRQLIFIVIEGTGIQTDYHRYGRINVTKIKVGNDCTDDRLKEIIGQVTEPQVEYHVHVSENRLKEKLRKRYETGEIAQGAKLICCTKRVETIEETERQKDIVRTYHNGVTNHRGIRETLAQLQRKYYWTDMRTTVQDIIGQCSPCNICKYERHPAIAPQEITETPTKPLEIVQADIWHWREGY